MTKNDFLDILRERLDGFPQDEINERIDFYAEMIDERVEEGFSEEEAVAALGDPEEISVQILSDIPLGKIVKKKVKPQRKLKAWEIVLLAVGSPIWGSLLIAVLAVIFSLYASLWSIVISLWAVFVSLAASSVGGIASGIILLFSENPLSGVAIIGAAIFCAGLSIFVFFVCKVATKSAVWLAKRIILVIKKCFRGKEKIK